MFIDDLRYPATWWVVSHLVLILARLALPELGHTSYLNCILMYRFVEVRAVGADHNVPHCRHVAEGHRPESDADRLGFL